VSFLEEVCKPFLEDSQNSDGGWGYHAHEVSRVEPTCWSLLALAGLTKASQQENSLTRARDWLLKAQLPDGSWPSAPGLIESPWVTPLACLALRELGSAADSVARGMAWLGNAWPGEGGWWWRLRTRLFGKDSAVRQNLSLRGWSWTKGTSSWVEPTSFALLALRRPPQKVNLTTLDCRRKLAEAMLLDRMCPGGGWNCGNPMVYGAAGQPLVGPTVWALLALGAECARPEVKQSLDWLEREYGNNKGPGSLSLAHLCLVTFGRKPCELEPALGALYAANKFLGQVPVMAWAAIALSPAREWYRASAKESS
jgi:hypothetical protein